MNPLENENIDELLSGYLDGELDVRQQMEVQRLIAHNEKTARRLERCKLLVGSLPAAEAPEGMLERIKASVENKRAVGEVRELAGGRAGARQLLARRLLAAAAMIGLVAVLGAVVYSILAPRPTERTVAGKLWNETAVDKGTAGKADDSGEESGSQAGMALLMFDGRLVVRTVDFEAVDAYLSKVIEENVRSKYVVEKEPGLTSTYILNCSRDSVNEVLAEMEGLWDKFASAAFSLQTGRFADTVEISDVRARQITALLKQGTADSRVRLAKNFAVLNGVDELVPAREILAQTQPGPGDLLSIPKPVLTSGEKIPKTAAEQGQTEPGVRLTIVLRNVD